MNEAFYHFLWDGKPDKIKRNFLINEYSDGGLKMIDLFSFNKSLKTIWIKKYLDTRNMGKWKLFFYLELGRYEGEAVFLCLLFAYAKMQTLCRAVAILITTSYSTSVKFFIEV